MNDKTEMAPREKSEVTAAAERPEQIMRPKVDIFEDATGITVHADMPGVSRDRLDIKVEGDVLTIDGVAEIPMPEKMEPIYADVRATHYQRNFTLSREMDSEQMEAILKDGVLSLRIPKREEHKPKKIEVKVG
ncbi:MAG TPA: Hsp20/alpha crystallin family protein [Chromatiaceae bacterium]|nr:Hsp20/alpha crystallin family protein [Chromatiaceae bacterium]